MIENLKFLIYKLNIYIYLKKSVYVVHESTTLRYDELIDTGDCVRSYLSALMLKMSQKLGHEDIETGCVELIVRILADLLKGTERALTRSVLGRVELLT